MIPFSELRDDRSQCRYPMTDEVPRMFCAEPVARGSYCACHARICFDGAGKPWQSLAAMIDATETTVVHQAPKDDEQSDLDTAIAGANWIDRPGGLMRRA